MARFGITISVGRQTWGIAIMFGEGTVSLVFLRILGG